MPTEPSFRPTRIMFWSKVSHRDLGLTVTRVGWLPSESQVANLCLCRARDYKCTDALFCFIFRLVLRTKLRSLCLPYKHLMSELSLPHLTNIFLMDNEVLEPCSKPGRLNSRFREPSFMNLELEG